MIADRRICIHGIPLFFYRKFEKKGKEKNMRKIIMIFSFICLSILSFANKGNYDDTKFRQDIINYAVNNLNRPYSNQYRMRGGYFDCSSYVGRATAAAGMNGGVTGKGGASTTTAGIRGAGQVKRTSFDQIKPGDLLNFGAQGSKGYGHVGIVLENLGNGKFKMAHASSSRGTVIDIIDVRTYRGGSYIGATSATQILINNGYTPINSIGQVVVPPNGSSISTNAYGTASQDTVNIQYEPSNKMDWDTFADNIMGFLKEGLDNFGNIGNIFIFIMTTFFIIQVIKDSIFAIADNNIKGFISGTIFKRTFGFVFYIFITNKIFSGELIQMGKDISYGILEKLTGEKTQKLNEIWTLKEKLASEVFEAITKINWINPLDFQKNLLVTIALLVIFVLINVAFLFIMFDLLKLLIGFELSLSLSPIFLTLGILDETRQYYNVGKIFSMIINFILKLVSINFFAIIGIKVLSENNTFQNLVDSLKDIETILTGNFILYIFLIFIIYTVIHKIEISF